MQYEKSGGDALSPILVKPFPKSLLMMITNVSLSGISFWFHLHLIL